MYNLPFNLKLKKFVVNVLFCKKKKKKKKIKKKKIN